MENPSPAKAFAKNLLLATRFQCLESNLNLKQLAKMNQIARQRYESLLSNVTEIEESYSSILEEYEIDNSLYEEIKNFRSAIDKVESSVNLLEEMATRLESKLSHI